MQGTSGISIAGSKPQPQTLVTKVSTNEAVRKELLGITKATAAVLDTVSNITYQLSQDGLLFLKLVM